MLLRAEAYDGFEKPARILWLLLVSVRNRPQHPSVRHDKCYAYCPVDMHIVTALSRLEENQFSKACAVSLSQVDDEHSACIDVCRHRH